MLRQFVLSVALLSVWLAARAETKPLSFIHYTTEDGLSSSYVKGIVQDRFGFVWVATREDVCRFEGNRFVNFPAYDLLGNPTQLMPNSIYCIADTLLLCESIDNYFYSFDYNRECFKPFAPFYDNAKQEYVLPASDNELVYIQSGRVYLLNLLSGKKTACAYFDKVTGVDSNTGFVNLSANQAMLVAATNNNRLLVYDKRSRKAIDLGVVEKDASRLIDLLTVDREGNIWYGSWNEGVCRMSSNFHDLKRFSTTSPNRITHNMVHCIATDADGNGWIGTENGLCIWEKESGEILHYQYDRMNPDGLNTNPIYNSFVDKQGNIWLGTYFGGINLWNCKPQKFKLWRAGSSQSHLGGKVVSCFAEDGEGNLWIGTEDMAINKLNYATGAIEKVSETLGHVNLSYNNVHQLLFVNRSSLWIATYSGGINVLDVNSRRVGHITVASHPNLASDFVYALTQKGNIVYIGTSNGLSTYNLATQQMDRFFVDELQGHEVVSFSWKGDVLWFCSYLGVFSFNTATGQLVKHAAFRNDFGLNQISCDSQGAVWVSTNFKGLIRFDEASGKLQFFNKSTGFPSNRIFAFQEDSPNSVWVSTNVGLVDLNPSTGKFVHYDNNSGVPFNQFNYRAAYKDSHGDIFFGGNDGMVSVDKGRPVGDGKLDLAFTELLLFNKHVAPAPGSPIRTSINQCKSIELKYAQNVFTLVFSAINYTQKGHISYAYKMEGFENEFNYVGNRNSATYTNLNPGEYLFRVKTSQDAWMTESAERTLHLVVLPPWWRTGWAFVAYVALFLLAIYVFWRVSVRIQKAKAAIALERQERLHVEEINQFKMEFFTNISHEIKTPLSLILGPLSGMVDDDGVPPGIRQKLHRIYANVKRLNVLLSELLEFRKLDQQSVKLKVHEVTDWAFIHSICDAFESISSHREIAFKVELPLLSAGLWLNTAIVEKIVFNLLSNAFKYCKVGGEVGLSITVVAGPNGEADLRLEVVDNGPGMSPAELNRIFDRFYQTPNAQHLNVGSGIGLSYVQSLVDLHRGTVQAQSQQGLGTKLVVKLPVSRNRYSDAEVTHDDLDGSVLPDALGAIAFQKNHTPPDFLEGLSEKTKILVVEDNHELSAFIGDVLKDRFAVSFAENGAEALDRIKSVLPELVLSDVMMPVMDGFELCHQLKSHIETSHIPVILLTAKGGAENQLQGLRCGADLYVEKPFFPGLLLQNIANMLATRQSIIKRFASDPRMAPSDIAHSAHDKEFIERLTQVVINNIDNPNLDVTFLVDAMRVSRSLLHIKLKNMVDCSTTEFVRIVRLRKAVELIVDEKCSFAEAAYRTGFTSPAYFSRAFKDYYGESPREYLKMST